MHVPQNDHLIDAEIQQLECRICFKKDTSENMIVPCVCSGPNKYVHRSCLDEWRSMNISIVNNVITNDNYNKCNICNFNYEFEINNNITDNKIKLLYFCHLLTDLLCVICICQLIFIIFALFIKLCDINHGNIEKIVGIKNFAAYYIFASILLLCLPGIIILIVILLSLSPILIAIIIQNKSEYVDGFKILILMSLIGGFIITVQLVVYSCRVAVILHKKYRWYKIYTSKHIVKNRN
jgi:hypothetical protein